MDEVSGATRFTFTSAGEGRVRLEGELRRVRSSMYTSDTIPAFTLLHRIRFDVALGQASNAGSAQLDRGALWLRRAADVVDVESEVSGGPAADDNRYSSFQELLPSYRARRTRHLRIDIPSSSDYATSSAADTIVEWEYENERGEAMTEQRISCSASRLGWLMCRSLSAAPINCTPFRDR